MATRLAFCLLGVLLLCSTVPAMAQTRTKGIDVSQWQGVMNWTTAYNQGVRFAFIRSSRGPTTGPESVDDTRLHANVPGARSAGILAGVYHFARPDLTAVVGGQPTDTALRTSARDEAAHFVGTAGAYMTSGYLRPVLDLEVRGGTSGTTALNAAKLSFWANAFIDEVQRLKGVEPLIYMNTNFAANYVDTSLTQRDLWIANWETVSYGNPLTTGSPPTGAWGSNGQTWSFWQYSGDDNTLGSTYGAQSSAIDLDVYRGSLSQLQAIVIPEPGSLSVLLAVAMFLRRRTRR